MTSLKNMLLATAMIAATATGAMAASYTVSTAFPVSTTDYTTGVLTLADFDETLGTLTGVTFTINVNGRFGGVVNNNAPGPQNFKITENTDMTINSGIAGLSGLTATLTAQQTYSGLTGGSSSYFGVGPGSPYLPTATGSATPTVIPVYTTGPLTFTISTLTGTTITGGGGNITTNLDTFAGGNVSATYTYTTPPPPSVPEPATIAILGASLLGLGMARRKRS